MQTIATTDRPAVSSGLLLPTLCLLVTVGPLVLWGYYRVGLFLYHLIF
jgi:hypothetical protein